MVLACFVWESRVSCTMNFALGWFITQSEPRLVRTDEKRTSLIPSRDILTLSTAGLAGLFWMFPKLGWVLTLSFWTRKKIINLYSGNTSHLLQRRPRLVHLQGRWRLLFWGLQMENHTVTETTLSSSWDGYKRLLRPNAKEDWRKRSCSLLVYTQTLW